MADTAKSTAMTVAVIALILGGVAGYAVGNNKNDDSDNRETSTVKQTTETKAAGLRVLLNNLEAQHVDLASDATRAGFSGSPEFEASAKALDNNSRALSDAVGSVYGKEAGDKFYEIWASHIKFFVDYTSSAKGGDQAGMDKAVQNLNGYVEAISDFLSKANPNLPKDAVASLITEHVGLLKSTVDKYAAADYSGSYTTQQETRDQVTSKVADTLSGAIVKQYPDKY